MQKIPFQFSTDISQYTFQSGARVLIVCLYEPIYHQQVRCRAYLFISQKRNEIFVNRIWLTQKHEWNKKEGGRVTQAKSKHTPQQ